jgi:hypothetical protein
MNLDDAQRQKVTEWIAQGLKLSDIQTRLASELGIRMTYMEARLLVDDLKLTPKDAEPRRPIEPMLSSAVVPPSAGSAVSSRPSGRRRSPAGRGGRRSGGRLDFRG